MSKKININYNDTFGVKHSRDYYRGASFHFSGKWLSGAHYVSDNYNIDFVVHGQCLLACAKSHLATFDNEPTEYIYDESNTVIGVVSSYWDFVISGIKGNSPGIKIQENYWYICDNTGVPEGEQVWVNTGVKAKLLLEDLSEEEIRLLQQPGIEVVTDFVQHVLTQDLGQSTNLIVSQKGITDEFLKKATKTELNDAIDSEVNRADGKYQVKGDYALNSTLVANKQDADAKISTVNSLIDNTNTAVAANTEAISEVVASAEKESARIEGLISDEESARIARDSALSALISQEVTNRISADNSLQEQISTLSTNKASNTDLGTLRQNLNSEITRATGAESALGSRIDALDEDTYSKSEVDNLVTSVYKVKGSVQSVSTLPSNARVGDVYNVLDTGSNYVWTENGWDKLSETLDLTPYLEKKDGVTNVSYSNKKLQKTINGTTSDVVAISQIKSDLVLTKGDVGLSNVDNTSDSDKPLSDAVKNELSKRIRELYLITPDTSPDNMYELVAGREGYNRVEIRTPDSIMLLNVDEGYSEVFDETLSAFIVETSGLLDEKKNKQTAKSSPSASGTAIAFIDTISQNADGEINATKKTVQNASASQNGLMSSSDFTKLSNIASNAQVNVIETIKVGGVEQEVSEKTVDLSPYADDLCVEEKVDQSFVYRPTANGELNWKPSTEVLKRIKGKTLVWNQMLLYGLADSMTGVYPNESSSTVELENGYIKCTVNNTLYGGLQFRRKSFITGHKYYYTVYCYCSDAAGNIIIRFDNKYLRAPTSFGRISNISTYTGLNNNLCLLTSIKTSATIYVKSAFVVDLTLMFGAGNEPSTVAEFEAMFPLPYYDYNPGELISNNVEVIETIGFNQWDEEWEIGSIDNTTGQNVESTRIIRTKNYISVIPSAKYYIKAPSDSILLYVYDESKNYVGQYNVDNWIKGGGAWADNVIITMPSNAYYARFRYGAAYGAVYNNDTCFNLSSASLNRTYEPYKKTTLQLNLNSFKVKDSSGNIITVNGLKSAGTVYDEIIGNKYIQRIGAVDMGTLSWDYVEDGNYPYMRAFLPSAKPVLDNYVVSNILTSQNLSVTSVSIGVEGNYGVALDDALSNGLRYRSADMGTSPANFKLAMSGVMLYYELASPIEYELVEPLNLVTACNSFGTEAIYPQNTSTPYTVPFLADIQYGAESGDLASNIIASLDAAEAYTDSAISNLDRNAFRVIAEHLAALTKRIDNIETNTNKKDDLVATAVDVRTYYSINGDKTILSGSGAPSMIPAFVGQFYINTSGPALYYSIGNSATSHWKQA